MAYHNYQNFLDHWGAKRTADMIDGDLAKRQSIVSDTADAAAGMIDAAARMGGFTTPIVASALSTDTAVQSTITAMLRVKSIVISTAFYIQPNDDSERIKEARADCLAWLKGLKEGNGLPVDPPVRTDALGLEWVGQTGATVDFNQKNIRAGRGGAP